MAQCTKFFCGDIFEGVERMNTQARRNRELSRRGGWQWVCLLFIVCAVGYGLLAAYPHEIAIYSDELRYLDIARSLRDGRGLVVRNMPSDYQKILYSLFLLPALALPTTALQIQAAGWLNAVYAASAVFPAYAILRRMEVSASRRRFLMAAVALCPTMVVTVSFMSENVFLPLSLWQIYLMLRAFTARSARACVGWCAASGGFAYLLYLNKEVALYYLMAYLLTCWWKLIWDRRQWKAELFSELAMVGTFGLCFVAAKLTLFRGLGNSYNQMSWLTPEQWRYLPFALVCDVLFVLLAFGVLPVLLPLVALKRPAPGSDPRRTQLPLFLLLCLGIGTAAIVWTITVREDLGSASPRQHTRYLEPLLMPLLLVALQALNEPLSRWRRRALAAGAAIWAVLFAVICRGIGPGGGDSTLLGWFDFVAGRLDRLPLLSEEVWLLLWRCAAAAVLLAVSWLALRRSRRLNRLLAVGLLAVFVFSYAVEWRGNYWMYAITAGQRSAASELNETLKTLDGTVLFVPNGIRQRDSELIETYVDRPLYLCEYEQMQNLGVLADGVLELSAEAVGPEFPGRAYEDLTRADWVLVSDAVPINTETLEPGGIACPEGYTLYRNLTPEKVAFEVQAEG